MTLRPLVYALLALLLTLGTARADTPPPATPYHFVPPKTAPASPVLPDHIRVWNTNVVKTNPGLPRLYLGQGRIMDVGDADQQTFHAHVSQFLWRPGTHEIAYITQGENGDTAPFSVRLRDVDSGRDRVLLPGLLAVHMDTYHVSVQLDGWSAHGRYVIVSHDERLHSPLTAHHGGVGTEPTPFPSRSGKGVRPAPNVPQPGTDATAPVVSVWDCVDCAVSPPKVRRIALPYQLPSVGGPVSEMRASPSGKVFALMWLGRDKTGSTTLPSVFVYNPAVNYLRRFVLPTYFYLSGWRDATHLLIEDFTRNATQYDALDIADGRETPSDNLLAEPPPAARAYPEADVTLSDGGGEVSDFTGYAPVSASALWLRVTPHERDSSSFCLAAFLSNGYFQNALAPDGHAAAWLAGGELWTCAFTVRDATDAERRVDGEGLPCDEQRALAEERARTIGRLILDAARFDDGELPTRARWRRVVSVQPGYDPVFAVAGQPFFYYPPDGLNLNKIKAPATFALGVFPLPCARVTLYADGHVTSVPLSPAGR